MPVERGKNRRGEVTQGRFPAAAGKLRYDLPTELALVVAVCDLIAHIRAFYLPLFTPSASQ